jgi:hypothetical protein
MENRTLIAIFSVCALLIRTWGAAGRHTIEARRLFKPLPL